MCFPLSGAVSDEDAREEDGMADTVLQHERDRLTERESAIEQQLEQIEHTVLEIEAAERALLMELWAIRSEIQKLLEESQAARQSSSAIRGATETDEDMSAESEIMV